MSFEMWPEAAPNTVRRFLRHCDEGFYDGLTFHRVIAGFMAQGGDPNGDGTGGSGQNIPAEFSAEPHGRGTASMARSGHPDSADSQFFITFAKTPYLDGKYTVWGRVTEGMKYVSMIKRGDDARNGVVDKPSKILKIQVAADAN